MSSAPPTQEKRDASLLPQTQIPFGSNWRHRINTGFMLTVIGERSSWLEPVILWTTSDGESGETKLSALKQKFFMVREPKQAVTRKPGKPMNREQSFELFLQQLVTFVQNHHRLPSASSNASPSELELSRKLQSRRNMFSQGVMSKRYSEMLDLHCPHWHSTREFEWFKQMRICALLIKSRGRLPNLDDCFPDGAEYRAVLWMDKQKALHGRGKLGPDKINALNEAIPGWDRKRDTP